MASDTEQRREEREAKERQEEAQKHREEAKREETTHSAEEGVAEKGTQRQTEVTQKWIQRWAYLNRTQDTKRGT